MHGVTDEEMLLIEDAVRSHAWIFHGMGEVIGAAREPGQQLLNGVAIPLWTWSLDFQQHSVINSYMFSDPTVLPPPLLNRFSTLG